jgi:hypothetical protein
MTTVTALPSAVPSADQFTNYTWAAMVLTFLGAPLTANNEANLTAWMQSENSASTWTGTAGANNPLNNGLGSGGGSGLGSYPDLITSAAYAAKGMEGGITGAAPIGAALKADAPFAVFHQATINATWSGNHYAGTGWASETSPASAPAVSAKASGHGAAVSSAATQQILNTVGFNDIANSTSFWQNVTASGTQIANDATGGAASQIAGSVNSVGGLIQDITSTAFWLRVGMGALGVALFGIGLAGFISTTKPGGQQSTSGGVGAAFSGAAKDAATAAVVA